MYRVLPWIFIFILCFGSSGGVFEKLDLLGRIVLQSAVNCGCPCREIEVIKCKISYETQCHQYYPYRDCKKIPRVVEERDIKIECQTCFPIYETVTVPTTVQKCHPVHDERCSTKYIAICNTTEECTMLYKTHCETADYSQNCEKIPYRKCTPVTKCHRTPETKCHAIQTKRCVDIPTTRKERREFKRCSPYQDRVNPTSCDGFMSSQSNGAAVHATNNLIPPSDEGINYPEKERFISFGSSVPHSYSISPPPAGNAIPLSYDVSSNPVIPPVINREETTRREFGPVTMGFKPVTPDSYNDFLSQ